MDLLSLIVFISNYLLLLLKKKKKKYLYIYIDENR